jgi:hypothetical protein
VTGVLRAGGKILRGVVASRGSRLASAGPRETGRTPGSAAGCNKPASPCAEKPGEVVRNHAVGTGLRDWHPEAEGDELAHGREWTRIGPSQEGAKLTEGRWGQAFGATRTAGSDPRRGGRREPVRAAGRGSGGEPKSGSMIHQQQCWLIGDAMRNASKVRCRPAQAESAVRPGRMRGRPTDPLRSALAERAPVSNHRQRSQARSR